ncbi:MAG: hypothetical protein V1796_03105 [Pseudomonadota bacterium]
MKDPKERKVRRFYLMERIGIGNRSGIAETASELGEHEGRYSLILLARHWAKNWIEPVVHKTGA